MKGKQKKRQTSGSSTRRSSRGTSRGTWLLVIGAAIAALAVSLGLLFVYNQRHVSSPLGSSPVISPGMVNSSEYQLRLWGTYR